jgi:hypothetical protein
MKYYEYNCFEKMVEEDSYEEGCLPNTCKSFEYNVTLRGDTLQELIKEIVDHFDIRKDYILFNSCDEIGRVDIQTSEDVRGNQVEVEEWSGYDAWKQGTRKLYACTYFGNIHLVSKELVDLSDME